MRIQKALYYVIFIALTTSNGFVLLGQKPVENLYSILVQQEFSSWGSCSSDPDYQYAKVRVGVGNTISEIETIQSERLGEVISFSGEFKSSDIEKNLETLIDCTYTGALLNTIYVHTHASDIVNDKDLDYEFLIEDLSIGKNEQSHGASDPCNNFISNNREGYTMTTNVYIDDPIHLTYDGEYSLSLDYQTLNLDISKYYKRNDVDPPVLEVARDDGTDDWNPISGISINSSGTIKLTYPMVAGEKDAEGTNYYKWMSKRLKFRIVKTLMNGKQTYGNIIAGIIFYPQGLQYSVSEITRSYCNPDVSVYVTLDDELDKEFFRFNTDDFYWSLKSDDGQYYHCKMSQPANAGALEYKITAFHPGGAEVTPDPFDASNLGPIEWTLQLMDKTDRNRIACKRTFTVPQKPEAIFVAQKPAEDTINGKIYHIPSLNNPYVLLEIDDPYDFAHLRRPYKIVEGSNTLATINSLPTAYANMTTKQKDSIDAIFEAEYALLLKNDNNPYKSYFDVKLTEWMSNYPNGIELPLPDYSGPYRFSNDGSFFVYEKGGFYYKAIENSDGSYSIQQKTNIATQGTELGGISPNGNILIYTLGSCCSGATLWQTPLNSSGINNGAKLTLPFNNKIGGIGSIVPKHKIFFDNNNIVISRSPWSGGNGIYKKNLSTGTLTKMYSSTSSTIDAQVSSKGKYILFRNGYDWYKGTISGNSLTGVSKIFSATQLLLSNDESFAIIDRDGKTYKHILTGSQAGTETLAASREIVDYAKLSNNNICYYYYNGVSPNYTSRGLYRTNLTGGVGTRIASISTYYFDISPSNNFLIYNNSKDGKSYKLYIGHDEASNELYPNQGMALNWFNDYKAIYKQKWLNKRLGVKVSNGIRVNQTQNLKLVDGDGCVYPFSIYVKAPPSASFETTILKNPTYGCSENGEASIKYLGGGAPPYVHANGKLQSINNTITVGGLKFGENTIYFSDANGKPSASIIVNITNASVGITSASATPQTCSTPNGKVSISVGSLGGTKTYLLTNENTFEKLTKTTSSNSTVFTGLNAGSYTVDVSNSYCNYQKTGIEVKNKIFDITFSPVNATTIEGSGGVNITFKNRVNNVNWTTGTTPSVFNPSENSNSVSYSGITPNTYNTIANHSVYGQTCQVSKALIIDGPSFEAAINIEDRSDSCITSVRLLKGNSHITPYRFRLLNQSRSIIAQSGENDFLSTSILTPGTYTLNLAYGSNNIDIYTFSFPLATINKTSAITEPACPGGNGSITIAPSGGIDGTGLKISTNGINYTSNSTFTVQGGVFNYMIKDENTTYPDVFGNPLTVNKSVINKFSEIIAEPDKVNADRIIPVDITCNGANDGRVSIEGLTGGSGSYQYRVDGGFWTNPLTPITGLSPGNHTIYLRDVGNGCTEEAIGIIDILQPDTLKIDTFYITQPTCELENGALIAEVSGGNGYYKFDWDYNGNFYYTNDSLAVDTISNLGDSLRFGLYILTVTDNKTCNVVKSINLNEYFNPGITDVDITDVACYGEANGNVRVVNTDGTNTVDKITLKGIDSAHLDTLENLSESFLNLSKGRYELSLIDSIGCFSDNPYPVVINQPDTVLFAVVDTIVPVLNSGGSTGIIQVTSYGGNVGLKTIELFDSSNSKVGTKLERSNFKVLFDSLYAGSYTLHFTDVKGCYYESTKQTVPEPSSPLGFNIIQRQNALCKAQTGSFAVEGYGGWGDYSYKRASDNGFYSLNTFNNLYAGNYIVTVQDKLGATFTDTITIIEPKDSLKTILLDYSDPTCNNNGELTVNVNGGTSPYKLVFDGTIDTLNLTTAQDYVLSNRPAGSYILHVTDSNGCVFEMETTLSEGGLLDINGFNIAHATNSTTADGNIEVIVTGGSTPLTYVWKELFGSTLAQTGATLNGVSSGHYEVAISESGGCSVNEYVYLPAITDLALDVVQLTHETSYLANNGSAWLSTSLDSLNVVTIVSPGGNQTTYSYNDSIAQYHSTNNNLFLNNLTGGSYFIEVTNLLGDKAYAEFEIEPYIEFLFEEPQIIHTRRINEPSGQIKIVVHGGAGQNNFVWEYLDGSQALNPVSDANTSSISNILAGNYRVTVTDQYNNSIQQTITIEQPVSDLDVTVAEFRNESCKDYEDAYVILQASGGWGDYQYRIDTARFFDNSETWKNLEVRDHYFFITDKMGITDSVAITITEPDYLTSATEFIDSVNCKDATDGNIFFDIKGGTSPYRIAFLNQPNLWTADTVARNLPEGTYEFVFTDSNNCTGQDTLTVYLPEPDSLRFDNIEVTHTTCDLDNGGISVKMVGGTAPYRYDWGDFNSNRIGSDNKIHNLTQSGYYFLDVLDVHNCPQHFEQLISPSTNPVITDVDTTRVLCFGDNTGTAIVSAFSPATPFAPLGFVWSNSDTGNFADGYAAGIHSVTIFDTNKCSTEYFFEVTQPDTLGIAVTGYKDAHCFGYNDGFIEIEALGGVGNYKYEWSTGSGSNRIDSLFMGPYSVLIADSNQCTYRQDFEITEPRRVIVDLGEDIRICPGNTFVLDGQEFATYEWSGAGGLLSNERFITLEQEGDYFLEVTDSIGCFAWDTINLSIGNDALQADFLLTSEAHLGDTLSIYEISNQELDSLSWEYNDDAFIDVTHDQPGYVLHLESMEKGVFNIGLWAYSGGCISKAFKQVEVLEGQENTDSLEFLGYEDPLITELSIAPNPSDGNFSLKVNLREEADIKVVLFSVNYGQIIDTRNEYGLGHYTLDYQLYGLNSGVYVIMVTSGNERKQIKMIIE